MALTVEQKFVATTDATGELDYLAFVKMGEKWQEGDPWCYVNKQPLIVPLNQEPGQYEFVLGLNDGPAVERSAPITIATEALMCITESASTLAAGALKKRMSADVIKTGSKP